MQPISPFSGSSASFSVPTSSGDPAWQPLTPPRPPAASPAASPGPRAAPAAVVAARLLALQRGVRGAGTGHAPAHPRQAALKEFLRVRNGGDRGAAAGGEPAPGAASGLVVRAEAAGAAEAVGECCAPPPPPPEVAVVVTGEPAEEPGPAPAAAVEAAAAPDGAHDVAVGAASWLEQATEDAPFPGSDSPGRSSGRWTHAGAPGGGVGVVRPRAGRSSGERPRRASRPAVPAEAVAEAVEAVHAAPPLAPEGASASGAAAPPAPPPWAELPGDVVGCVARALPPQASQAQALAGVCRSWRCALLSDSRLLARIAFALDPTHHLRGTAVAASASASAGVSGGPSGGANPTASPAASSPADSRASSTGSAPPAPAAFALGQSRGRPTTSSSGASGSSGGSSCGDGGGRRSLEARRLAWEAEDRGAMAEAMARQYTLGAFVLPSGAAGAGAGRLHALDGAGAEADVDVDTEPAAPALLDVVPREAARRPPRLLVEAARAGANPSAQLVMAQLAEGSGDPEGALRWWRRLAAAGCPMGQFKMGLACYEGSHGVLSDPETAHMWLSRALRTAMGVDSLAALPLDAPRASAAGGGAGGQGGPRPEGPPPRVAAALREKLASLEPPAVAMVGWAAIVLGFLEFDGVAGRAAWGMGDRSGAVRLFRLAEAAGRPEASTTLGWMWNTGQY
ncbi:hypothetical protein HYH03_002921 [Edaphochlamys debaryana]|uniref:F-box domain-containing protein n=1 Tax=Edaphochlamys debaryana TaxID=47281 RepID=A0A836C3Q2_9CHLO|nr:hypothetical protein HYH03_002921 [Edaphochlamys debaryana]|eukprot:KAG2499346.1 hypothetical protein HYH03_002921 [Edaphochlamys debaryana]